MLTKWLFWPLVLLVDGVLPDTDQEYALMCIIGTFGGVVVVSLTIGLGVLIHSYPIAALIGTAMYFVVGYAWRKLLLYDWDDSPF